MIKVVATITGGNGSNVFLFPPSEMLSQGLDPLRSFWISGKGQQTTLFEFTSTAPISTVPVINTPDSRWFSE